MVETREERGWQAADNNVNLLGGEENKKGTVGVVVVGGPNGHGLSVSLLCHVRR